MRLAIALLVAVAATAAADPAGDLARARAAQARQQWAACESLATAALSGAGGDSLGMADALYLVGYARWRSAGSVDSTGRRAAFRALGIRERHLDSVDLALADAHALAGRFFAGIGRADSAAAHVRRTIAIRGARLAPDDTLIAQGWDQLALVQRDARDMHGALDSWNRAIAIVRQARGDENPEVARLLAQTGVPYMELGDLARARRTLEGSLAMFGRTAGPDAAGRWIPLNILADLERRSGDLARDIDLLEEALRVVRLNYGENAREALTVRTNLAFGLHDLGDLEGEHALLTTLLPLVAAQYGPAHPRTLPIRFGLAVSSIALGDTTTGLRLLREQEALWVARGDPPDPNLVVVRAQIADALYRAGRDREALATAEGALRTAQACVPQKGETLVQAYRALILCELAVGDTAALARSSAELAAVDERYVLAGSDEAPGIRLHLARAAQRLGRRDEAWTQALDAEAIAHERLVRNLRSLSDRRARGLTAHEGRYLDLVVEFAQDEARRAVAWDRLVRARGAVRAELARRLVPPDLAADTTVTNARAAWLLAQRTLAQRLVAVGGQPRDSSARAALAGPRDAAESAETAYARVLASHGARLPAPEAGLADVRMRLKPDQALVGCFATQRALGRWYDPSEPLVAFVARGPDGPVERVLLPGDAELRRAIEPWRAALAHPGAESECRRLGAVVRRLTWDRLAPKLAGMKDVYLVADGPLLELPWQALPAGGDHYLVEAGPRIHWLHAERELVEDPLPARAASLLAVGAPAFDQADASDPAQRIAGLTRSAVSECANDPLPALPGSGIEAQAIAAAWRTGDRAAELLRGADATEAAFKREAVGREVIHLATHGVVIGASCDRQVAGMRSLGGVAPLDAAPKPPASREASPWAPRRVWLALAGANRAKEHDGDENEGFLTAEEVLTLDLAGTDWVVLSACHSGAGNWAGEGALGMRRAFDLAGARTVIASDWAISDEATAAWMRALYAARAGHADAAAAVESADRAILAARRKAGTGTHPFHWAAFRASGD